MIKTESLVAAKEAFPGSLVQRVRNLVRQASQVAVLGALAVASYFLISHFVVQSVSVVGSSMVPTLHDSERYLLNRWIYHFRNPQRFDIVVLRDPGDGGLSVKRIIAVAGDTVLLSRGQVFLNGQVMQETYLAPATRTFSDIYETELTLRLGPDQFFVLGDNRGNSVDSRAYGLLARDHILGLVVR